LVWLAGAGDERPVVADAALFGAVLRVLTVLTGRSPAGVGRWWSHWGVNVVALVINEAIAVVMLVDRALFGCAGVLGWWWDHVC
jgi:hypothetical protein